MQPARPAEARALEVALGLRRNGPDSGARILGITLGRAQALVGLVDVCGGCGAASACCWVRDEWVARLVSDELAAGAGVEPSCGQRGRVGVVCRADPPEGPFDLAVLPFSMRGEAELTRETLQETAFRLVDGGTLVASTDNPSDTWLAGQLAAVLPGARRYEFSDAAVYVATRTAAPRRRRDFSCELAFRDRARLLRLVTRPGVFSHRHVDPGARRLLDAAEIGPGERAVDIGCGAGTVAIGLAARAPSARLLAVDSDSRAVECAALGALRNGLTNVETLRCADGQYPAPGGFDLAVTNPPYYADHQIAARMVAAAARSLRPGGRMVAVTKFADWYRQHLPESPVGAWLGVQVETARGYAIVRATRA